MITEIVAVGKNFEIGKANGLLFKLPLDMKHFKEYTTGKFVICGENTLLSFPKQKPLPNRITIVLCKEGHKYADCICVHSLEECLQVIEENTITENTEFCVIGGGMVYKTFLPYADKLILTKVNASDPDATVFYPNVDKDKHFKITNTTRLIKDGDYKVKFVTYERVKEN